VLIHLANNKKLHKGRWCRSWERCHASGCVVCVLSTCEHIGVCMALYLGEIINSGVWKKYGC